MEYAPRKIAGSFLEEKDARATSSPPPLDAERELKGESWGSSWNGGKDEEGWFHRSGKQDRKSVV